MTREHWHPSTGEASTTPLSSHLLAERSLTALERAINGLRLDGEDFNPDRLADRLDRRYRLFHAKIERP